MSQNQEKNFKMAVVDVQWLVNHTPSVHVLRQEQQQKNAALQQWVSNANAEIVKITEPKEKEALAGKYRTELAQQQQSLQRDYAQKVQVIDVELTKLIAETAEAEGYTHVFAKGSLVYGGTDITQAVADRMAKK